MWGVNDLMNVMAVVKYCVVPKPKEDLKSFEFQKSPEKL